MTEKIDINDLFEKAMSDPTLFSTMDINKLLESIENDKNDYLENKSMKIITREIYEKINSFSINPKLCFEYCQKLVGYRMVDDIHELHKGKHIRWIRESSPKLTNGGIVMDIKFLDTGTHVLCMSNGNRFIQIKFDDCIIFQKMSLEEQLIMMAYDYLDKGNLEREPRFPLDPSFFP
jgi:NDP-sugar pyrophosphorylase family protein